MSRCPKPKRDWHLMKTHIVIGAGQAGAHAAVSMRRAGFDGRIVLLGDELVHSYERPPLSKSFITELESERIANFFPLSHYLNEKVQVLAGVAAEAIDPAAGAVSLAFGGKIPFDKVILATGSRPRTLSVPGSDRVLTLRTFADAVQIKKAFTSGRKVVCIGAGVIGLELASAAISRGCQATVLEVGDRVMARSLDKAASRTIEAMHRDAGVEFAFGHSVVAVEPHAVVTDVGLRIPADVVVAGIGVDRNVALAQSAGVSVGKGVLTDASGRTNIDCVLAAGEVAEFYSEREGAHVVLETSRHAQMHGTLVGQVAAGQELAYDDVPWFWSDQHGANIQVAGSHRAAGSTVYRGDPLSKSFCAFYLNSQSAVVGAFGLNAGRDVSAALRLIRSGAAADPEILADITITSGKLVSAPRA